MVARIIAISGVVSIGILVSILYSTQPSTIGPFGILLVFTLMYVATLSSVTFFLYFGRMVLLRALRSNRLSRRFTPWSIGQSYYFSSVVALAPVMLIGMGSVGEVGIYEFGLVVVFVSIVCFYITKRTN
jgi:protein-S-isoprenylcysteine O-methyltransferase Ste14